MDTTQAIERMLTPQEFSDVIQVPITTLAQWRSRKTGPKATVLPGSRLVRYSASSIQEWLNQGIANRD